MAKNKDSRLSYTITFTELEMDQMLDADCVMSHRDQLLSFALPGHLIEHCYSKVCEHLPFMNNSIISTVRLTVVFGICVLDSYLPPQ